MMEHIFNTDNGFWQTVGKAGDLILLTFLTVLCSLPVVTAGASLSAMNYACFKILEDDSGSTAGNFFHSFRQNLAQGVVISLIMVGVGFLLWYDRWFLKQASLAGLFSEPMLFAGRVVWIFLAFFYFVLVVYLFPLQARFYNPLRVTFKNAAAAGFRYLPNTLMILAGDGGVFLLTVICFSFIPEIAILPLLVGLPLCGCYNAWVLRDLLKLVPGRMTLPVSDEPSAREEEKNKEDGSEHKNGKSGRRKGKES